MKKALPALFVLLALGATALFARAGVIKLANYQFDTAIGEPALPADLTAGATAMNDHGYFLIQTGGPITEAWRNQLTAAGAVIYGYVPDYALLVGLDHDAQARARKLAGTVWMGAFQPAYKISPAIGQQVFVSPERLKDPNLTLMVRVFQDLDGVAQSIQALGGRVLDRTDDGFSRRLVVSAPRSLLGPLARIQDVWWIEEKPEFRVDNNTTRWVIQSNSSGYTPIWDHGIMGAGQIATIMDTGVDYNSCWFRDTNDAPPGPSHRKIIDYTLWGGNPYDGCDTGHGSHVAGTLVGDQSFINPGDIDYNGMAYKAKLTVQDVGPDTWETCNTGIIYVPNTMADPINAAYQLGARVHSNSWGSSDYSYDGYCVDVDHTMWQHPDMLVCFANGNGGPNGGTVGSPAISKDCVSVGATQQAPNQENIAWYSSRGPAPDGRYKPTVCAPGGQTPTYITSVDNDPGDPPTPTCQTQSAPFQGTSMATPAVSGAALLVREYFTDGFYPSGSTGGNPVPPSAALIKAMLIAGTHDMNSPDVPNNTEGWGRILLDNSMYFAGDTRELIAEDVTPGLTTGQSWPFNFTVSSSSEPLVIALVWTDYPGTQGTGTELVNNLDLTVTSPGNVVYKGNVMSGGQSVTGGSYDLTNVEEGFRLSNPSTGTWSISVKGQNVPQGPQPFAIVINGAFANWPPGVAGGAAQGSEGTEAFVRAWPNPVSHLTSLHYAVPGGYAGPVELSILDVEGRAIRTLVRKGQTGGEYHVTWECLDGNGVRVPDGVYFARLTAGSNLAKAKLVVRR